jgi:hypothetical protein
VGGVGGYGWGKAGNGLKEEDGDEAVGGEMRGRKDLWVLTYIHAFA